MQNVKEQGDYSYWEEYDINDKWRIQRVFENLQAEEFQI
jgi:hypothetical protein